MAEEPKEAEEAPAKAKKSPIKLILVILLALAVVGGGAAGVMMFLGGGGEESGAEGGEAPAEEEQGPQYGPIIEVGEFTVNLNEATADRYLRVKIDMEIADPAVEEVVTQRLPLIHDSVLLLLSGLRLEDIDTVEDKDQLKAEILARIEQFLQRGAVRQVLFQEFLVQ